MVVNRTLDLTLSVCTVPPLDETLVMRLSFDVLITVERRRQVGFCFFPRPSLTLTLPHSSGPFIYSIPSFCSF